MLAKRMLWMLAPILCCAAGCADGPLYAIYGANPYLRRQWNADEEYRPTIHRQLEELEALRSQASSLPPASQQQWTQQLSGILANESNSLLRGESIRTLGYFSIPEATEVLRVAINDADPHVRQVACEVWGQRGGPEAVQVLSQVLGSDTHTDVRMAAAKELRRFPDPVAVTALGSALDDGDPAIQYRAMESLKDSTGRDYGNRVVLWREFVRGGNPAPPAPPSIAQRLRQLF